MITLTFLVIGKLKESYWSDAVSEYSRRLSKFAKVEWIEIEDERIPDQPSEAQKTAVIEAEGRKILAKIPKDAYLITLEIEGDELSSPQFADVLGKIGTYDNSRIGFVIGGSLGLSPEVKARAKKALSFSKMTFPHQLMRVVLLEQIYRAFTILNHITYHK